MKIRGNTVGTPMPRSNWNQTDPKKADFILNKPTLGKSAYEYAKEGGYTGTEDEFRTKLATDYLALTGGRINGDLIVTGVSSLMTLHSYNPLYINNGTDNSKSTSLYTTDNNEFAIVSTGNTIVSMQSPTSSCLRNSKLVSTDTNPTVDGEICWTFK